MWIDSHCHLDAPEFSYDLPTVRAQAREHGVSHCVIPAVHQASWVTSRRIAHQFGDRYTLGIHPLYIPADVSHTLRDLEKEIQKNLDDPLLVGVGEIGLDRYFQSSNAKLQLDLFVSQLQLAKKFSLPVIVHVRQSLDVIIQALRQVKLSGGIAHAFNGSLEQALQLLKLNFCLGFGGAVTYDRAHHLRRLLGELPDEGMVLETDAPDIPPQWVYIPKESRMDLRQMRNTPLELVRIAGCVAQLRKQSGGELVAYTNQNVARVLRW
ncbi:MAG: TatD family hydrolase [Gammaproteobacteria bacterium]|nr:TatD family hydrolase [Gammaproteobacteria bacterium]